MIKFYIYAGNYNQYEYLIHSLGLTPVEARYVASAVDMRGMRQPIIQYGTYYERSDYDKFRAELKLQSRLALTLTDDQ